MVMIRKALSLDEDWTRKSYEIDTSLALDTAISDGAYRVYSFYAGMKNGYYANDAVIMARLNISQQVLTNRKAELKKLGLIKKGLGHYRTQLLYIGDSAIPAVLVEKEWQDMEYRKEQGLNLRGTT